MPLSLAEALMCQGVQRENGGEGRKGEQKMTNDKAKRTERVVADVLKGMRGERWESLYQKLQTKGLRALIAEATLEETRIIQARVLEILDNVPVESHEEAPVFMRFQRALLSGIEEATWLPWPALHEQSFQA